MFITFEGIDLCGKSTQAKLLHRYLKKQGKKVLLVREPGGTFVSEAIRKLLLDNKYKKMLSLTEFFLFSASRYQLTEELIKPYLKKGYFVLCDRYFDSSTAYQGYGGKIEMDIIKKINTIASNELNPDITFFVDIDIKEAERRRKLSGKGKDRMEQKKVKYFQKVINGYRELSKINKKRFVLINGKKDINEIQNNIIEIINKKLNND